MRSILDSIPGSGWKTYVAGFGMILVGVGGIALHVSGSDSSFTLDFNQGIELLLAGLAVIGIGHKVEKAAL